MKNLLLLISAVAMVLTGCNDKKSEEHGHDHTEGTHEHANDQGHEVHEEGAVQEEFIISKDSASGEDHDHQHEAGEVHQH